MTHFRGGGHVRPSFWDSSPSPIGYSTCWCIAPTCRSSLVMTCINVGSGSVSGATHGPRPAWSCCCRDGRVALLAGCARNYS